MHAFCEPRASCSSCSTSSATTDSSDLLPEAACGLWCRMDQKAAGEASTRAGLAEILQQCKKEMDPTSYALVVRQPRNLRCYIISLRYRWCNEFLTVEQLVALHIPAEVAIQLKMVFPSKGVWTLASQYPEEQSPNVGLVTLILGPEVCIWPARLSPHLDVTDYGGHIQHGCTGTCTAVKQPVGDVGYTQHAR